ncbi:unnamed protein product [Dracunculus medinensis]|uniref:Beta-lactamase domain-containing protein n=1 Tax=Dracunculus medinensis TaxID=318479 RepID=A0A0N4UDT6_DRAME|nr:unnamed protein product [Dracunculus medinensis]
MVKNFKNRWEVQGAAIAVYHKDELVVDLQGGYADASSLRKWADNTRTIVFSTSKAIGALCIALLVDKGLVKYSDLVSKYWPEFAQNGKESITIDWIMSHRAALAAFDEKITQEDACNYERMADIIAKQQPNWTPGKKCGYHALTFGWLVDQLIRRIDPKHRSVARFFREEIAIPFDASDIDFFIGLPPEEEHTVSRISVAPCWYTIREMIYDPRILILFTVLFLGLPGSLMRKMWNNCKWFKISKKTNTVNDPELHRMEQIAILGITKAKDLAKMFMLFAQGKLISKKLLQSFEKPQIFGTPDKVVWLPLAIGHGFSYEKHPYEKGRWLFGHPGYGGSTVMVDLQNELVVAYVTNGLKTGMGELTRTYRLLRNAALRSVR